MWLITPSTTAYVWDVNKKNVCYHSGLSNTYAARPSIYFKSNVVITGGSGTKSDPFTIALKD